MEKTKNPFNPELLLFLFIIMLAMPYMISGIVFTTKMDFGTNTGTLGDTIGGLTAPFIGFLSSILVFYAFREQIKANEIQIKANNDTNRRAEEDNVRRNIETMFSKINNYFLSFEYEKEVGRPAFKIFSRSISDTLQSLSQITQEKYPLGRSSFNTKENAIAYFERSLKHYVVYIRHASILIELCIAHIEYLNRVLSRHRDSEISEYIQIATTEISLFYLNRLDLYVESYKEHISNVHGHYRTALLDHYVHKVIELDNMINQHTTGI